MLTIRKIVVAAAAILASGLLFANVYNSIVDAPNWGHNIPASLIAAREYFQVADPGTFYRLFSPVQQVLTLVAVVICWTANSRVRYLLIAALVISVSADVFTFGYFYPRNEILFRSALDGSNDAAVAAWSQWSAMNWVRSCARSPPEFCATSSHSTGLDRPRIVDLFRLSRV